MPFRRLWFSLSRHWIRKILYFTDGVASQYKNRKEFFNLVNHKNSFGIAAEWHFFTTSRGKYPCNAVGSTTKWQAARASLQCLYDKEILTTKDFYEFVQENIYGKKCFYVSLVNITKTETVSKEHFSNCMQILNTRENHWYIPFHSNILRFFCVNGSCIFFDACVLRQYSGPTHIAFNDTALYSYVACRYGGKWWIGVVMGKSDDSSDSLVKFMHSEGPSSSFTGHRRIKFVGLKWKAYWK
jgi:hypothetical protein